MFRILTVHARQLTILLQKHASVLIIEQLEAQFGFSLYISSFCLVTYQNPIDFKYDELSSQYYNFKFNKIYRDKITINNVI